jgi:hypothetical protein
MRETAGGSPVTSETTKHGAHVWAVAAVVALASLLLLGLIWYGLSAEVHQRIWKDIAERPAGPMSFRFLLQPIMAGVAALHDGINDARLGRDPYFWTVLTDARQRGGRVREGLVSTGRIVLLGLAMDIIYQARVFDTFYPGEAVVSWRFYSRSFPTSCCAGRFHAPHAGGASARARVQLQERETKSCWKRSPPTRARI